MRFSYLSSAELSDAGRKRSNNEDAALRLPEAGVFGVADGMGGALDGEIASRAVIEALSEAFSGRHSDPVAGPSFDDNRRLAREAALNANAWILDHAADRGISGTGSTLVAMVFDPAEPHRATVLHAGDSRAYRLRGDTLLRLTMDHSLVAEAGIEDEEKLGPMFRSLITRAIGIKPSVELEETPTGVLEDDLFLLCSDGLTSMLGDPAILAILKKNRDADLQELAYLLVDAANQRGGIDNITVVLVKVGKFASVAQARTDEEMETPDMGDGLRHESFRQPEPETTPHTDGDDSRKPTLPDSSTPTPTSDLECVTPVPPDSDDTGHQQPAPVFAPVPPPQPAAEAVHEQQPAPVKLPEQQPAAVAATMWPPEQPAIPEQAAQPATVEPRKEAEIRPERPQAQAMRPGKQEARPEPVRPARGFNRTLVIAAAAFVVIGIVIARDCRKDKEVKPPEDMSAIETALPPPVIQPPGAAQTDAGESAAKPQEHGERLSKSDIENMRRMLPTRIDSTLTTGEWGHMADHLNKWSPVIENYLAKSGRETIFAGWHLIWRQVQTGEIEPVSALAEYRQEVAGLCRKAGLPLPPEEKDISWSGSSTARADIYCGAIYRLQRHMSENVSSLTTRIQTENDVLGTEPYATLSSLWFFVRDGDEKSLMAVASLSKGMTNDLNRLDRWLLACGDSPISLSMIKAIPSTIVPYVIKASTEQKQAIEMRLALVPSHAELWRRMGSRETDQILGRIEQTHAKLYPQGANPAVSPWESGAGRKTLKTLLGDIRSARRVASR